MDVIGRGIVHGTGQFAIGLLIGTIADNMFCAPGLDPTVADAEEAVHEMVRASAQVLVYSMASAALVSWLLGLSPQRADPTNGIAFLIATVAASPVLVRRVGRVASYVTREIRLGTEGAYHKLAGTEPAPLPHGGPNAAK